MTRIPVAVTLALNVEEQVNDEIQRDIVNPLKRWAYHERRQYQIAGIGIDQSLRALRFVVDWLSDVRRAADERLSAVVVPVSKFVAGAESHAMGTRIRTDIDDGAVSVSDDLRLTVH